MSSCKDCLHYEVCRLYSKKIRVPMSKDDICDIFTNRSEWVHLPCKVGDTAYIIKSQTSDNKNLHIVEDIAKRIVIDKSEDTGVTHARIEFFNTSSISDWLFQNIFHTRKEAEKASEKKK